MTSCFTASTLSEATYKRVWILEDDPNAAKVLVWTLRVEFETLAFQSLRDMRAALATQAHRPDLCVADLTLSDVVLMKELAPLEHLPCPWIALTGDQSSVAAEWARRSGAVAFLNKPLRPQELLFQVRTHLSARKAVGTSKESPLILDPIRLVLKTSERQVALTPKEMALVHVLLEEGVRGVARPVLQEKVWQGQTTSKKTLHVQMTFLRRKLNELGWTVRCSADSLYRLELAPSVKTAVTEN